PYVRQAAQLDRNGDPTLKLLQVRALAASGERRAAQAALRAVAGKSDGWVIGQRMELARWQLWIGDARAAHRTLKDELQESVAQMYRDSILASGAMRAGKWKEAADLLAASERKVPSALTATHVDRAWRNAQRELWWVQLRRAICAWNLGD